MHHSHPLEEVKVKFGRNNRDEIKKEIELYLSVRMSHSQIHTVINQKFNTSFRFNEIYYMITKIKNSQKILPDNKSEHLELIARLEKMCAESPEARFVVEFNEDKTKIKNLLIQTPQMHRLYEKYSDVIFMDATYKTNKYNMPLTVLSSVNNEGKNIVVGFALVQHETKETYEWLMKNIKKINDGKEPGVIHTDFDPAM